MRRMVAVKSLLLIALLSAFITNVGCFHFSYPKFEVENETDLIRYNSYIVLNAIQLTPDVSGGPVRNLSGRVLYKEPFKLWRKVEGNSHIRASFNSTFVFNMSPETIPGGEGLAFILTGTTTLPENSEGKWLGIVNANTNGSSDQAKVVAVEFDTTQSYAEDIDNNHVGLDVNSINSIKQVPLSSLGVNLSSSSNVSVSVLYDGNNMTVFVSMTNETGKSLMNPVLSEPLDLSAYLPEKVFVGFSASTSNYTEVHSLLSWEFHCSDINEESNLLWLAITTPLEVLVLFSGIILFLYCIRKSEKMRLENSDSDIDLEIQGSSTALRNFRLRELEKATGKFNPKNKLGTGGFGTVYKGALRNEEIAVKRVSKTSSQGKKEFVAEVTIIGNLHHKNLVKLIGWCYERHELLLVYDYMPNGSLDKYIYCDEKAGVDESTLVWEKRFNVICGVAQALDYIHNGCEKRVLHRDIKASNIMLDSEFNARLGDFGLARIIQQSDQTHHSTKEIAGTLGYMAPESFLVGRATVETDVYAFGVLVLEVACGGRIPCNRSEEKSYNNCIVNWLWELHRKGEILDAADPLLNGEFVKEEMECVLILGLACCHPNQYSRPSMKTVLQVLTRKEAPPHVPNERPAFVWPPMPPSFIGLDDSITVRHNPFTKLSGR